MILAQTQSNAAAIVRLDDKLDRKIDLIHGRITHESEERGELTKEVGCLRGKLSQILSRINWVYVILGGFFLSVAGAVVTVLLKG